MKEHLTFEELSDYQDDALAPPARERAASHLRACVDCRNSYARLRSVVAAAHALPESIEPPAGLWRDVAAAIDARKVTPLPTVEQFRVSARKWYAAAAVAGIVLLLVGGRMITRSPAAPPAPPIAAAAPTVVARIDQDYLPTVERLSASLRDRASGGRLPAGAVTTVNRSLQIVDDAIVETRAALARDPSNRTMADLLSANYRRKLDLLKRASELDAGNE
jgi:hypothetical protein